MQHFQPMKTIKIYQKERKSKLYIQQNKDEFTLSVN